MKTQVMFQRCPKCGRLMNPRSKTCGLCAGKGKKTEPVKAVTLTCLNCGEQFQLPEWRVNQGRGKYCSVGCKNEHQKTIRGKDHPKYTGKNVRKGGYSGTSWREARKVVLARAGGKCERCRRDLSTVKRFVVHHNIGSHLFENEEESHTVDNMTVLCQSCHAKFHRLGKMPEKKGGEENV